jgi:hypothetical protein
MRNEDVNQILMGTPSTHTHIRTIIETNYGSLIFQEATIANLLRAFITLKTHPGIKTVYLTKQRIKQKKSRYAEFQLLEEDVDTHKVQKMIDAICLESGNDKI